MDCSPPGSSVLGILQARILEWVTMPFSRSLPHPGIEPMPFMSPALADGFFTLAPYFKLKVCFWGIPWKSRGWDSEHPIQGTRVWFLVGELRSPMPHSRAKKLEKLQFVFGSFPFASLHSRKQNGSPAALLEPSEKIQPGFLLLLPLLKPAQSDPSLCEGYWIHYGYWTEWTSLNGHLGHPHGQNNIK